MATDTVDPLAMPCRNVPKKGFLDELNLSGRGVTILGLLLILLIVLIPRGLTPYPDPPIPPNGDGSDLLATGSAMSGISKMSVASKDRLSTLIPTSDGGFALAMNTHFEVSGDRDTLLVKTDMNGIVQWTQTYGLIDTIGTFVQTFDGGYALFGSIWVGNDHLFRGIKTDASGNVEWNKTGGNTIPVSSVSPIVYNVIQTNDGGFVFAGIARAETEEHREDMWLMKTDNKGTEEWSHSYSGVKEHQDIHDLIQTEDGGFIFAGATNSMSGWSADIQIVKTDSNGILEWRKTYGGFKSEWLYSIVQTNDGGFAFAGETGSFGGYDSDLWLVKTDSKGIMEWNKVYGGENHDSAYSLVQTSDDGYVLAGCTYLEVTDSQDTWLIKTDSSGEMKWNKTYGGSEKDEPVTVIQRADHGFVIAGTTVTTYDFAGDNLLSLDIDIDTWLLKTDKNGEEEWKRIFEGTSDEEFAKDLIQTTNGDFVFNGYVGSRNLGRRKAWLVKTDEKGLLLWNQTFGGEGDDDSEAIIETNDGGYAIAGSTNSFGAGKSDAWLVKTNKDGLLIWNQTYGGSEDDGLEAVIQTADGGFALAGVTHSLGAGNSDAWLIKTDKNGVEEWNQTYGENLDDKALNLFQLANGSLVIFGYLGQYIDASCHSGFGCWHWEPYDNAWLLVTDENGILHKNYTYEQPGVVRFHDLIRTVDDAIIITGLTATQGDSRDWMEAIGQNSLFYLRFDENGLNQWDRSLSEDYPMTALTNEFSTADLILTTDGGLILTGYLEKEEEDGYRSIVKMNSAGIVQWTLTTEVDILNLETVLIQTTDGGYALAGGVLSHGTDGDSINAWLSRIDEKGTMLWEKAYGTTGGLSSSWWELLHKVVSPARTSSPSWAFVITTLFVLISVRKKKSKKKILVE